MTVDKFEKKNGFITIYENVNLKTLDIVGVKTDK